MKREIGKQLAWLAAISCLLMLSCASLWGQATASASLQGTVVDKSQAVLGKANVTITNKETGASRTTQTNDLGEYRFDLLRAGIYTVKANAQGFSAAEAKDVEVLIGRTATQNFTLNPGNVNEIVEVTSAAPIVDLEKTDVSTNITPQQIGELFMNMQQVSISGLQKYLYLPMVLKLPALIHLPQGIMNV